MRENPLQYERKKQVRLFLNENKAHDVFLPHPKYQNNNIENNQMKMSKFDSTES